MTRIDASSATQGAGSAAHQPRWGLVMTAAIAVTLLGWAGWLEWGHGRSSIAAPTPHDLPPKAPPSTQAAERGALLARAGNCAGCHTQAGGAAYAGGRGIPTPFGTVFAGNLTPDEATGLGRWSANDFWQALHHGRSRDGRLLYPAFPYTNTTLVNRADADDLWAYLRRLPPVRQANRAHQLEFPINTQAALAVWRALYFTPAAYVPDPLRSKPWNRGAYLVRGLGHCNACHAPRNALGAAGDSPELRGGTNPQLGWHAPNLAPLASEDRSAWQRRTLGLLRTGRNEHTIASGPMAEVVFNSLQHLPTDDLAAMATFLSELPPRTAPGAPPAITQEADAATMRNGAALYDEHCALCHGKAGMGEAGAYPALAGNPAVLADPPTNAMRLIIEGGFPADTPGHPKPYGMPPFGPILSGEQIAAVLTYIRNAWGQRAPPVSALEVKRAR
jgi:mono/diheme cytochrome c family protein